MNNTPQEIIKAWVTGKNIQHRLGKGYKWIDILNFNDASTPKIDFQQYEYRIKSEPKTIWIRYYIVLGRPKNFLYIVSDSQYAHELCTKYPLGMGSFKWVTPIMEFVQVMDESK